MPICVLRVVWQNPIYLRITIPIRGHLTSRGKTRKRVAFTRYGARRTGGKKARGEKRHMFFEMCVCVCVCCVVRNTTPFIYAA